MPGTSGEGGAISREKRTLDRFRSFQRILGTPAKSGDARTQCVGGINALLFTGSGINDEKGTARNDYRKEEEKRVMKLVVRNDGFATTKKRESRVVHVTRLSTYSNLPARFGVQAFWLSLQQHLRVHQ